MINYLCTKSNQQQIKIKKNSLPVLDEQKVLGLLWQEHKKLSKRIPESVLSISKIICLHLLLLLFCGAKNWIQVFKYVKLAFYQFIAIPFQSSYFIC